MCNCGKAQLQSPEPPLWDVTMMLWCATGDNLMPEMKQGKEAMAIFNYAHTFSHLFGPTLI